MCSAGCWSRWAKNSVHFPMSVWLHFLVSINEHIWVEEYVQGGFSKNIGFYLWYCKLTMCEGLDVVDIRDGSSYASPMISWWVRDSAWACILKKNFNNMAFPMYSSGRMPASMHRLAASDDLNTPVHAFRHLFCIGFSCCRNLDLDVPYICALWCIFNCTSTE